MLLQVTIQEHRIQFADIWRRMSKNRDNVVVVECRWDLSLNISTDAVLVLSRFGHENFGGVPVVGESTVLGTMGRLGSCRWLVTTPLMDLMKYSTTSLANATFLEFSCVFGAINEFNRTSLETINSLCIAPAFVGFRDDTYEIEAEAVLRALDAAKQKP